jgi:hypothetical protein
VLVEVIVADVSEVNIDASLIEAQRSASVLVAS